MVLERSYEISGTQGRLGVIVPISLVCTKRMKVARRIISSRHGWISSFDIRPSGLFQGVTQRLSVLLADQGKGWDELIHTAGYRRWFGEERPILFETLQYIPQRPVNNVGAVKKLADEIEQGILAKSKGPKLENFVVNSGKPIYLHRIVRYFIKALDFVPTFIDQSGKGKSEDYKQFLFSDDNRIALNAYLNSTLFYWYWRLQGDGFHCGYHDVYSLPFTPVQDAKTQRDLLDTVVQLMRDVAERSVLKEIRAKTGTIKYQEFRLSYSKPIMDRIDTIYGGQLGFSEQELDFIINYDIKYRMGKELTGRGTK